MAPKPPHQDPSIGIRELQTLLHMDVISGEFDEATRNAVMTFRRLHHMEFVSVDKMSDVDEATLAAIKSSQEELTKIAANRHQWPPLHLSSGAAANDFAHLLTVNGFLAKPVIVLDAGHGRYKLDAQRPNQFFKGKKLHAPNGTEYVYDGSTPILPGTWYQDPGAKSANGKVVEADVALAVTLKLAKKLREAGFDVRLTRSSADQIMESRFDARLNTAMGEKALHLVIHVDDDPHRKFPGVIAYYGTATPETSQSRQFAAAIGGNQTLPHHTDLLDPFLLGDVPASLVEIGNLCDPKDAKYVASEAGQENISTRILDGVLRYYQSARAANPTLPWLVPEHPSLQPLPAVHKSTTPHRHHRR